MKLTRWRTIAAAVLAVGVGAVLWWNATGDALEVQQILRLHHLPGSVRHCRCKTSWVPTDYVSACYFEVDPIDFDALLVGWRFDNWIESGRAHDRTQQSSGLRVGEDFDVAAGYSVWPKNDPEFPYGGCVMLLADKARSRVIVTIYIE